MSNMTFGKAKKFQDLIFINFTVDTLGPALSVFELYQMDFEQS